ncbi:PREDICTED: uncharacterized protein LOC106810099 [Priapulus caudatus]|uniref:Uncharacterized protein LOC106810099 n=1 Tax=Priapulus caudatus TaxID=37621 RepID=A0ABM1E9I7_PRICU|nr:PREDICTED: uncharacterized protein LOC106810099 [Priapulus caudatus]
MKQIIVFFEADSTVSRLTPNACFRHEESSKKEEKEFQAGERIFVKWRVGHKIENFDAVILGVFDTVAVAEKFLSKVRKPVQDYLSRYEPIDGLYSYIKSLSPSKTAPSKDSNDVEDINPLQKQPRKRKVKAPEIEDTDSDDYVDSILAMRRQSSFIVDETPASAAANEKPSAAANENPSAAANDRSVNNINIPSTNRFIATSPIHHQSPNTFSHSSSPVASSSYNHNNDYSNYDGSFCQLLNSTANTLYGDTTYQPTQDDRIRQLEESVRLLTERVVYLESRNDFGDISTAGAKTFSKGPDPLFNGKTKEELKDMIRDLPMTKGVKVLFETVLTKEDVLNCSLGGGGGAKNEKRPPISKEKKIVLDEVLSTVYSSAKTGELGTKMRDRLKLLRLMYK